MRYNEYDAIKNEREVHFMKRLRILGLILTVLLVSFAFASCGKDGDLKDYEEAGGSAGLLYAEKDDGTCAVAGIGECTDTEIVIPTSSPDGLRVSEIGSCAFRGNGSIVSVKIQGSVTAIGDWAFQNCSSLASVSLGENVQTIGNGAFGECAALTAVAFPDKVAVIGPFSFFNCTGLTSLSIGQGVSEIGGSAFYGCTGITEISLGTSVKSIGSGAFSRSGLKTVNFSGTVGEWCSIRYADDPGFTDQTKLLVNGENPDERVTVPEGVTEISSYTFPLLPQTTSVVLPKSLKIVEYNAFGKCAGLKKVEYTGTLADWCGIIFDDSPGFDNVEDFRIGGEPIEGDVVIPEGVTKIGDWGFALFKKMTSVSLPNSLVSIGRYAFAGCTSLRRITIPDGVKEIKDYTFNGCSALRYVDLGHGVEKIGYWAFHSCCKGNWGIMPPSESGSAEEWAEYYEWCDKNCGLSEITIPASVKYISSYAFFECMQLEKVTFENTEGWTRGLTKTPADVSNPSENAVAMLSPLTAYYSWERVSD